MNEHEVNELFAAIMEENELTSPCPNSKCSAHNRVDSVEIDPVGATYMSYEGDYFIITGPTPDRAAIAKDADLMDDLEYMMLLSLAGIANEEEAERIVKRLPLVVVTEIYEVGDGTLAESADNGHKEPCYVAESYSSSAEVEHSFFLQAIRGGTQY